MANTGARAAATKRVGATPKQVKKGVIAAAKPGKPAKSAKGAGARSGVVAKTTAAKPVRKASAPVARPAAAAKKPVEKPPVVVKTAAKAKATTSAKPKKDAVGSKTAAPSAPLQAKPETPVRKPRPKSGHKVHLPLVVTVAAPPPPEPPRRHLSPGAIRAFEHAVKVFNRRQFEDAREMFESLKTRFPNDVEIAARSQMYIQVCVQKVAQSKAIPRNADELYDRGVFALNIGDFSQARQFFEKALRINPDAPHLLYSLAATHAQVGAHAEALEYLRRSIQIQPRFRSQAYNDADFSELRENKQFLELLGLTSPFDLLESKR
ncbi:MAG: tetratricopeptide repeat protein [Blastocatellia bacterium]|nr:tetratricopeptide repeat protein [Blastocatellia bacterium]